MRTGHRPSPSEIRQAIEDSVGISGLSIHDIARKLKSSRSVVQRILKQATPSTTYTDELKRARRDAAVRLLIKDRKSVAAVARSVGVSPDYLRVLLKPVTHITPGQLRRAVILHERIERWRRRPPPLFWGSRYRALRADWTSAESELRSLFDAIPHDSPLRRWADVVLQRAELPDFRLAQHRDLLEKARRKEAAELMRGLREALERT